MQKGTGGFVFQPEKADRVKAVIEFLNDEVFPWLRKGEAVEIEDAVREMVIACDDTEEA